ncbi:MAG: hypothetical protein P4K83_12965 [Terracidiphilus sp.]|nr:hypothetical protein [Terracidiphilus sp.]
MKRNLLFVYQWMTALSDTGTGVLLYLVPEFTLRLMGTSAPADAMPYVGYVGAFVLAVGIVCFYGLLMMSRDSSSVSLETVWLVTAIVRGTIAIYVLKSMLTGELQYAWCSVAAFDGACAAIQAVGLRKGWLRYARA